MPSSVLPVAAGPAPPASSSTKRAAASAPASASGLVFASKSPSPRADAAGDSDSTTDADASVGATNGSPSLRPRPSSAASASAAAAAITAASVLPKSVKDPVARAHPSAFVAGARAAPAAANETRAALLTAAPTSSVGMTTQRKVAAAVITLGHVFAVAAAADLAAQSDRGAALRWAVATVLFYFVTGTMGITAGAHRLWSHRAYQAALPARVILMLTNTVANQSSILHWSREHRVHHLYADSAADPYDISRGFFYAHMGWVFSPRTDAFAAAAKLVDCSDLEADPVVMFQDRHYGWLSLLCCFALPALAGAAADGWTGRGLWLGFAALGCLRWVITLHVTWLVNSLAHWHGYRPYNDKIEARETGVVSLFSGGEGWHNYHHAHPYDYSAAETEATDVFWRWNLAKFWIDLFAAVGWVSGRKVARAPVKRLCPSDRDSGNSRSTGSKSGVAKKGGVAAAKDEEPSAQMARASYC